MPSSESLQSLQAGDDGAAILDAVNYSVQLLDGVPKNRKRVLLLISETRDHGSHSATIDDIIKALGNSNIVVYTLAFSPAKSNVLDTLRGNNNPDLHPEQTEVHERPGPAGAVCAGGAGHAQEHRQGDRFVEWRGVPDVRFGQGF